MSKIKFTDFKKFKGIQIKWKKIYILMHRILMKQELCLSQKIQLKNMNLKTKIIYLSTKDCTGANTPQGPPDR